MLSTDQKGAVAETALVHAAVKLGIDVYRPVSEGGRYDLILDLGRQLLRVQCKWAVCQGDVVIVPCYSSRRTRHGSVRRRYAAAEIDAIAADCAELDACYYLPPGLCIDRTYVYLRRSPTRNRQRAGVNWAHRFDFGATLQKAMRQGP